MGLEDAKDNSVRAALSRMVKAGRVRKGAVHGYRSLEEPRPQLEMPMTA